MRKFLLFLTVISVCLYYSCDKEDADPELKIDFLITDVSTPNGTDGSIDITVSGGAAPYTYEWSDRTTNEDLSGLTAGLYTVNVEDSESLTSTKDILITQPFEEGTVTDYEGNIYKTVKIGDQWWMAENLKSTKDKNGTAIENLVYGDVDIYGRLYKWDEAVKAAPEGWHVPTWEEWMVLIKYLGGTYEAGGRMKQVGTDYWVSPNVGASNSSGFNALPAGESDGHFQFLGEYAIFWTSTEIMGDLTKAKYYYLNNEEIKITEYTYTKAFYYSVRCVKD